MTPQEYALALLADYRNMQKVYQELLETLWEDMKDAFQMKHGLSDRDMDALEDKS
jgi:hypothetical protein